MIRLKQGQIGSRVRMILLVAASTSLASAVSAEPTKCFSPESRLPQNQVQAFLNNPAELLSRFQSGGGGLTAAIRNLVATDSATLPAVIQLIGSANPRQRTAIGSGLATAAQLCLGSEQAYSGKIQTDLAATGDIAALTAFVSAGGQLTGTAAAGADAPAATAFVSGAVQVTGNSVNNGNDSSSNNGAGGSKSESFPFSISGGGGGSGGGASNPVSNP
jgi:hypothetical protein